MPDIVSAEVRSRMMSKVRPRDTGPELLLRRTLHKLGVRGYRVHRRDVPGRPDIVWIGRRLAVFVDGAFWHGHPSAYTPGKSGAFWDKKISDNAARDRRVDDNLRQGGWTVMRFWDFEVEKDARQCAEKIRQVLSLLR